MIFPQMNWVWWLRENKIYVPLFAITIKSAPYFLQVNIYPPAEDQEINTISSAKQC